jgi:hypothetical protein
MNAGRGLAVEFFLATGINSWGALKQGYAPWPPVIIASCIAMAILSMVSAIDEKLAVLLGAGFLMASIMSAAAGGQNSGNKAAGAFSGTFGALPQNVQYDVLQIGGGQTPSTSTPGGNNNATS